MGAGGGVMVYRSPQPFWYSQGVLRPALMELRSMPHVLSAGANGAALERGTPERKRRRLRSKVASGTNGVFSEPALTTPSSRATESVEGSRETESSEGSCLAIVPVVIADREEDRDDADEDLIMVDGAVRKRFLNKYNYWWKKVSGYHRKTPRQRVRLWEKWSLIKNRDDESRKQLVGLFIRENAEEAMLARAVLAADAVARQRKKVLVGRSVVYTWQPDGTLLYNPDIREVEPAEKVEAAGVGVVSGAVERQDREPEASMGKAAAYPSQYPPPPGQEIECGNAGEVPSPMHFHPEKNAKAVERLCEALRADPGVQSWWEEFLSMVHQVRGKFGASHKAAWCMEVCDGSWVADGRIRLHFHLCLVDEHGLSVIEPSELVWAGVQPHVSMERCGARRTSRGNAHSGLYYLSAVKIAHVFSGMTHEPHKQYSVAASWIWSNLSAGKMTLKTARRELCSIPNGIRGNLGNLEVYERKQGEVALARWREYRQLHSDEVVKPWKKYPVVDEWLAQYRQILHRYAFLVLDGPSRLGKTQYARSIAGPERTMEVSMSGGGALDMGSYDPLVHEVLVIDEADPQTIVDHKQLFQAGEADVALQTSATNCHSLVVNVSGKKIIVCSNVWSQRLRELPWEASQWVRANSFYLGVEDVMWDASASEGLPVAHP